MAGLASSLRSRIRLGALGLVILGLGLGVYAMPQIFKLGDAVERVLRANYSSIEAGMHMHAALHRLQIAELRNQTPLPIVDTRAEFMHWMDVENDSVTEVGEAQLAHDIQMRATRLFGEIASAPHGRRHDAEIEQLNARADDLIAMNEAAMFRYDDRAKRLSAWLAYSFGVGLVLLAAVGIGASWTLGRAIARPLETLAGVLRDVSGRRPHPRLEPQKLVELETVALEFNRMAEQLEYYDRMNLEQLLYEKSKIEAIVESLEDGVVLLDSDGRVAHINEIAALIMGIEQHALLGKRFDSLSGDHPQCAQVCKVLNSPQAGHPETLRSELSLKVRGHEHTYVIKLIPLKEMCHPIGTLLVLQDVTYLRDQERARNNLFGTLSHELRTPLTSLTLSAQLLRDQDRALTEDQRRALTQRSFDEAARLKQLTLNLLTLSKGALPPPSVQRVRLDVPRVAGDVINRFMVHAQSKHIRFEPRLDSAVEMRGDPEKLPGSFRTWSRTRFVTPRRAAQ